MSPGLLGVESRPTRRKNGYRFTWSRGGNDRPLEAERGEISKPRPAAQPLASRQYPGPLLCSVGGDDPQPEDFLRVDAAAVHPDCRILGADVHYFSRLRAWFVL